MSIPLRITPRPVNTLRAAPTPKWDSIAIVKAIQAAVGPLNTRNGATGMNAPTAVETPVSHPSLKGVAWASPIFSSSRTCSSRARCESRITSAAILRAMPTSMPFVWYTSASSSSSTSGMIRISSFSIAISWSYTSCSLFAAR